MDYTRRIIIISPVVITNLVSIAKIVIVHLQHCLPVLVVMDDHVVLYEMSDLICLIYVVMVEVVLGESRTCAPNVLGHEGLFMLNVVVFVLLDGNVADVAVRSSNRQRNNF